MVPAVRSERYRDGKQPCGLVECRKSHGEVCLGLVGQR